MSVFYYSLSENFGDVLYEDQLVAQIKASPISTAILTDLGRNGDQVRVVFSDILSDVDQATLNTLVTSYVAVVPEQVLQTLIPRRNTYSAPAFQRCVSMIFSPAGPTIVAFACLSYMTAGVTSYTIRVMDTTNRKQICTGTFTNTAESACRLTGITDLPQTATATFEVQIAVTGGSSQLPVYVDSITVLTV